VGSESVTAQTQAEEELEIKRRVKRSKCPNQESQSP